MDDNIYMATYGQRHGMGFIYTDSSIYTPEVFIRFQADIELASAHFRLTLQSLVQMLGDSFVGVLRQVKLPCNEWQWGELKKTLTVSYEELEKYGINRLNFKIKVIDGSWECQPGEIMSTIVSLKQTITRRNNLIRSLRGKNK